MSTQEIKQILDTLAKQDAIYKASVKAHKDAVAELKETVDAMVMELGTLRDQLKPINAAFVNATGFGRVTLAGMKIIGLVGVALGVIYAGLEFIKHR